LSEKVGSDAAATAATDDDNFNYKKLRDRIRCYYKTHVQNSKKRLITLLKNPTRPKNRDVLIRIVDDIKARVTRASSDGDDDDAEGGSSDNGSWDKLSPNGKAALRRLEEQERRMGFVAVAAKMTTTTMPDPDSTAPENEMASTVVSLSSSTEGCWNQNDWKAPSSPPKVSSIDVARSQFRRSDGDNRSNAEAARFSSPCKPEHAAMLQSIRSVSLQL